MISIIACIAKSNRAIGYQNRLLYHIKSDMARFRELTTGHTIVMGRKTFESLPNGALPNRKNIVISRTHHAIPNCEVYPTLERAFYSEDSNGLFLGKEDSWATSNQKNSWATSNQEDSWATNNQEVFIIGGESIYRQALPLAERLYLTLVDDVPQQADTYFPVINAEEWEEIEKETRNENGISFTFLTLQRKRGA